MPAPTRNKLTVPAIFTGFGFIYALISLVNHYNFRTPALDLGMVNHAIYDYARFRMNTATMLTDTEPINFLASHFTLIPMLVSPLHWIFGSYTMLVVQLAAILFGGWGVYKYSLLLSGNNRLPVLILLHFFLMWGIYSALAFNYHDNVVGAMFLPWFLYYFERRKWLAATLFILLLIISKENMALWGIFIGLGCAFKYFPEKRRILISVAIAAACAVYFMIITKLIMPSLYTKGFVQMVRYEHLGGSYSEIVWNLLTNPGLLWQQLFMNTTTEGFYDYIKVELWAVILLSGGLALLIRPWYLVMLIPVMAQKLLSSDYALWGINYQYSIEFAPVLSLALLETVLFLKSEDLRKKVLYGTLFLTLFATVFTLIKRQAKWYDKTSAQFWKPAHYKPAYDRKMLKQAMTKIPEKATISVSTMLAPWLYEREKIYHFPVIRDAAYVFIIKGKDTYPLQPEEHARVVDSLRNTTTFRVHYEDEQALILARQ